MKSIASYLRVFGFLLIAFLLLEFTIDSGEQIAVVKYPIVWAVLAMVFLFAVAVEIVAEALRSILFRGLNDEAKARFLQKEKERKAKRFSGLNSIYQKMLGSKPIEEEGEIVLDHNYDGIRELDNKLPPWWVWGFYATILFAVIYLANYHLFGGTTQTAEFEAEMEDARLAFEEYKKTAKDLVDASSVVLLTDAADLSAGKAIYDVSCVACHKADGGGGIGPNLTDEYWFLGGGIKNVFNTISEGGRDGKGMIPWKTELKPSEMAQVASFILSLQGTTPAEPLDPQGEKWVDPDAVPVNEIENEVKVDSVTVESSIEN